MNPSQRDGWSRTPGSAGGHGRESEQPGQQHRPGAMYGASQSSPHTSASATLPPPTGHFVPYQQAPPHTGQGSPRAPAAYPPPQHHAPGYGLRESMENREREAREVHIKEEQDARREREMRERQLMDPRRPQQSQNGPIQLHQPVAVAPRGTIHGPHGILGNPAVAGSNAHQQMSGPPGAYPQHQQQGQAVHSGFMGQNASSQAAAQAAAQGQPGQQPILNDALSYLDQVKIQFSEHPDVYNRFLDIMKDFKSGQIDTPGVIDRVSTLFTGNPDLIQGFNTFLPPGYRIECGTGDNPNAIRVTTPMGHQMLTMPGQPHREISRGPDGQHPDGRRLANDGWSGPTHQVVYSPTGRAAQAHGIGGQIGHDGREMMAASHAANDMLARQAGTPQPEHGTPGIADGGPDGHGGELPDDRKEPVEFNHAINYVNKIKNRFASQPEIYKSFLDILQTYQRESRPIQEVYAQVTKLFESATDLLEDFKQFLPETTAKSKAQQMAQRRAEDQIMTSNVRGDPGNKAGSQLQRTPARADQRLPPVGNFAPTPTANKDHKRKRGDTKSGMSLMPDPKAGPSAAQMMGNGQKKAKHMSNTRIADVPQSPTLVPALPEPLPPTVSNSASSEELAFFDRVKKTIANKNTMNEFLKLCNLFTQDLIDKTTLVHRARSFIGQNPDLYRWFQKFVGYEDEDALVIENRARPPTGRIMLSNCRGLGPSYRLLPKRERLKPCSGRDELCNEVLNDDWASHPTWASEDSGFIAHRKNVHEEGLHKIEEERHDYDFHIGACARTIQLLEPYAQQLLRLSDKDRESIEIPPGIGGQSETIHKRIIKKIYGRADGQDVIEHLHSRPYAVVPVVLNRLKQKLEEWKNAQREWEKVWRDQTQKIFWKSLDHQAVNAKQADKRQFQTKTLLVEIQTKYEEQKKMRVHGGTVAQVTKPQLMFAIEDMEVIADALCLVLAYADQYHSTDYPRLTGFVKDIIPIFFGLDVEQFNSQVRIKLGQLQGDLDGDDVSSNFDDSNGTKRRTGGKREDLRRGVLDRGKNGRNDGGATPLSRATTPDNASRVDEDMSEAAEASAEELDTSNDTWAEYPAGFTRYRNKDINLNEPYRRTVFNLYGNTSIYCFIRMFVILYERLSKLKESEEGVHEAVKRAMMGKPAIDLGLIDKQPNDFFADTSESANYYQQILTMLTDFIRNNEMDMSHIEETLRRYYLQCGWQLYSADKLLSALVRFAIGIMGNDNRDRSAEILQLFKKDRVREETTYQEEMNYRKQAERMIKDGDTYKISYDQEKQIVGMKVFRKDEPTFETSTMMEEDAWRVYVADFLSSSATHGTPMDLVTLPILKRNIRALQNDAAEEDEGSESIKRRFDFVRAKEALDFKISVGDYKLFFQPECEEFWHQPFNVRAGGAAGITGAEENRAHRGERLKAELVGANEAVKALSKEQVEAGQDEFRKLSGGAEPEGDKMEED